jgi:glycosyltransferase involved in cell wall biosynthesis
MACGTPVICSNTTSLPEVVGNAALLIDPDKPGSMTEAIRRVNDEPTHRELAKQGLARAQTFTWERTARRVADHLLAPNPLKLPE